jgi:HPt (histidine-containing phosphotransfer) domain-containing protein
MTTNGVPKQVLYYADEPISEMMLLNIIRPLGSAFEKTDSLEAFFDGASQGQATINLLDITHSEDLQDLTLRPRSHPTSPIWLITDEPQHLAGMADDYLPRPLSIESFRVALAYWLETLPIFSSGALLKLSQSGGNELVLKILPSFNDSLNSAMVQTFAYLNENNLIEAAKHCHAIKASAKLVGAEALYNLCLWIEMKKRHSSPLSENFMKKTKQIFLKTQKFFESLTQKPIEMILRQ